MRSAILFLLLAACGMAGAQDFPNKPIRIVVPWPPSGNVDITARTLAPPFGEALGQQIIVENKAGAGGRIGTEWVVEASTFTGIFAPAGTPQPVLARLSASLRKAMSGEAVRERYRSMGVEVMDMAQPEFAAYVRADHEKWRRVTREGNIVVE